MRERNLRAGCPATGRIAASQGFVHQGFVHYAANGARAAAALRAATEAVIDLSRGARSDLAGRHCRAHVLIREHVAGTHNHCRGASPKNWSRNWSQKFGPQRRSDVKLSIAHASGTCKEKSFL